MKTLRVLSVDQLSVRVSAEFGGWGMQKEASAALEELARRARRGARLLRIVKMARKAILAWANSDSGEDVDLQLSKTLTAANKELQKGLSI